MLRKAGNEQMHAAMVSPEEEEYQLVIEKMKSFVDAFKSDAVRDHYIIRQRFEAVFDCKQTEDEDEEECVLRKTLSDVLEKVEKLAQMPGLEFQIFRYKRQASEDNCIDFELCFASEKMTFTLTGKAYYKNGMIVRGEDLMWDTQEKVAGEIWTTPARKLTKDMTERDFGRTVQALPSAMNGQMLGGNGECGMLPADDAYKMLRINLEFGPCNSLLHALFRRNDVIKLTEGANGRPYAGGACFRYTKRKLGLYRSLTLFDANHNAIAFCERSMVANAFTIYGTRPLVAGEHAYSEPLLKDVSLLSSSSSPPGQQPSRQRGRRRQQQQRRKGGGVVLAFYPWFRVKGECLSGKENIGFVSALSNLSDHAPGDDDDDSEKDDDDDFNSEKDSNAVEDGSTSTSSHQEEVDFEPIYRVTAGAGGSCHDPNVGCIRDYFNKGASPVSFVRSKKAHVAGTGTRWVAEVDIAPGADPIMVLCIVGCLAEF